MKDSVTTNPFGQPLTEIKGKPGIIWGNVVVPASGRSKITIKLLDDLLQTRITLAYGLENKEIYTRLDDIGSIEIVEGRLWWLLWLGLATIGVYLIGIIFIVLFLFIKQRWIVIYAKSVNLVVFYNKAENVEQFRTTVLAALR
ncbi:hypothetical protein MC7420_1375 [Coleofasciculus chthonoplastes PCC 7420]|uniref:Uncharacterized protein n=1 Tax=Coleofasciculus chthonoplastes PCC 7420 TaxID=118168 RepID=B4VRB0_9CYAN|nr:hypothetical protein [Coleofasciculus chthonoplastes]EDX75457.1 hypothetical protein MC7420_1375 [Coleofasciculus chthonoplastes PCC 7420]